VSCKNSKPEPILRSKGEEVGVEIILKHSGHTVLNISTSFLFVSVLLFNLFEKKKKKGLLHAR
jgi:hypothetical protein